VQKLYSGGVLGILFVFTTTPARGLCLCVNTNIADAFAPLYVLIRRWKTRKKLSRKKNTYRVFYRSLRLHGFSLSLYPYFSLGISRTVKLALKNTYSRFRVGRAHPRVRWRICRRRVIDQGAAIKRTVACDNVSNHLTWEIIIRLSN